MLYKDELRNIFFVIRAPAFGLIFLLSLELFAYFRLLPDVNQIFNLVYNLVSTYGLIAIGPISFIENLYGVNVFFPGSIVILTAMATTGGNPTKGFVTFFTIYFFAFFAYIVNFFIGKKIQLVEKINDIHTREKFNLWIQFFITMWHPHTAAVTCMRFGSEGYKFSFIIKYIILSGLFWNCFWGIIMYYAGLIYSSSSTYNLKWLVYVYLIIWLFVELIKYYRKLGKTMKVSKIT